MGLAFDIALMNTPLKTVYEIRDVLRQMEAAGEILVIGERKQLVFHVVPHPSRLGYFHDVYARTVTAAMPGANVIPSSTPALELSATELRPSVSADIVAVRPTDDFAEEWWAADDAHSDVVVSVSPAAPATLDAPKSLFGRFAAGCAAVLNRMLSAVQGMVA
jgi:hypothetical protein